MTSRRSYDRDCNHGLIDHEEVPAALDTIPVCRELYRNSSLASSVGGPRFGRMRILLRVHGMAPMMWKEGTEPVTEFAVDGECRSTISIFAGTVIYVKT